ncbi:hypothetical protein GCM10007916_21190 [Psychromonas marina]|uniref:Uncharacterized protein n=2 Tax=Psychromonas marina TaxID=88364 RepID=A0ABQ6E215_9GAMM|nr:hypothetical protein GCM10007916_21190 [Psychromonas marina]
MNKCRCIVGFILFLLLLHNPTYGSKIYKTQEEILDIHVGYEESIVIGDTKSSYFQTSILGALFKFFPEIIESLFKFIGDLIIGIFDVLTTVLKAIFDGLSWIFDQVLNLFDVVVKFFFGLVSEKSAVRSVLDAPDGTYSHSFVNNENLSDELANEISSKLRPSFGVFASIPTGADDYHKIFPNTTPSPGAINEIKKVRMQINNLQSLYGDGVESTVSGRSALDFANYLSSAKSDYVTIIGHNDDGDFAFLTPPSIGLTKMAAMCVTANKKCIFLSCESSSYIGDNITDTISINPSISYDDAFKVVDAVIKSSSYSSSFSLAEIETVVQKTLTIAKYKPVVQFVVVSSSSISGLAGIVILIEDEKAPNKEN